jgi:hypothetical protein
MTMTRRDDLAAPPASEDEGFVRHLADAYRPPPMTEARRARFDARLEERLASRARARRRPLLAATATAAIAFAVGVWGDRVAHRVGAVEESPASVAASAEAVLDLATGPVADAEEALPAEYRAISYLLIDARGGTVR